MFSCAKLIKNCYFFLIQNNKFGSIFECSVKDVLVTYVTKKHFFRVNVFNMRLVIESIIFSSSGGDENAFLYGRAVPSFPSALQSSALLTFLILP